MGLAKSRLAVAVAQGALDGAQGRALAVFRPTMGHDLSPLSDFHVDVITGFYPDYEHYRALGFAVNPTAGQSYGGAVVFLPRSKGQAKALIAQAMAVTQGGPVLVDGQKTDGVDSIRKDCRAKSGTVGEAFAKSHGKIFCLSGGDFSDWAQEGAGQITGGFQTTPGVFSADGVDPGSELLVRALPDDLTGWVADLGAGWGYLSSHVLQSVNVRECHLIEAEYLSLSCAKANISDQRAKFHWKDALIFQADVQFDHVVTNPPFHTSRAANPDLGRGFITAASRLIRPQGSLWLVANRHLPYEQTLADHFTQVERIADQGAFKVFRATGAGAGSRKTVQRRRRRG